MAIYRSVQPLHFGKRVVPAGEIVDLGHLDERGITRLLRRGAIAELHGPPLAMLPGWRNRSKRVAEAGVIESVVFLEANVEELSKQLRVHASILRRWQDEVRAFLMAPYQPLGKGG